MFVLASVLTNPLIVGLPVALIGTVLGIWAYRRAEEQDKGAKQTALDLYAALKSENLELTEQLKKCRAACAVLYAEAKERRRA